MLLFHYRNESGSVKRDRGEAAYSRAAFISDSSENASKHAAMGEKVSGFQSGGSSVPHTCPQVPAAGSLPHATARLLHSEAQVAEVSRQRVPPGSLLTLGAPRDAGRPDGQTHTHTYIHTRARQTRSARSRRSTLPGTRHYPEDQRADTTTSAPGAGHPAPRQHGTVGTRRRSPATFHSRSLLLQQRPPPPPSSARLIPAPPRAPSGRRGDARPAPSRSRSNFCRAPLPRPRPAATPRAPLAAPAGSPARAGSAAAGSSAEPAPRASPGGRGGAGRCRGRSARSARRGALPRAGGAKMEARLPPAHPGPDTPTGLGSAGATAAV